ncbi:MAG: hypothetical protein J7K77_04285 [Dehalococcoidales bacterium]|nr:hypothetical protein [Dehalococcoidales bacterium]
MNNTRFRLEVVRDMLKVGSGDIDKIGQQLGLTHEEFDQYCAYLSKAGLAKIFVSDGHIYLLQPTSSGEALLLLVDKIEALDAPPPKRVRPHPNRPSSCRVVSLTKASIAEQLSGKLLQAYVLEQAELIRVETQLRDSGDEGEELVERQRRLTMLHQLLEVIQRLAN